ncbi:MAG: LysR family transcriptional regulator [Gammaproteobacteria bacterium]
MDLRQLRAFVAAVELGSINRAATRLGMAQPSVSAQVRQLEATLGQTLLVRRPRGVEVTAAGRELYRRASDILARVEATRDELAGWGEEAAGPLRAGIIPTLCRGVLARVLPGFVAAHPRVELRVLEAYTGTLVEAVLAEEIDFAVVMMPRAEPALVCAPLARDELVLIAGPHGRIAAGRALSLAALPPQKLVLPSPRHSLRREIDRLVDSGVLAVARTIEIDGLHGTLQFLRHSDFVALLPHTTLAGEGADGGLVVAPIAAPTMRFAYSLIHHRRVPLARAARALVEQLAGVLAARGVGGARAHGAAPAGGVARPG